MGKLVLDNEIITQTLTAPAQHEHCKKFASLRSKFFIFKDLFTLILSNIIFLSSPLAKLRQKKQLQRAVPLTFLKY